jgi:hypothetical protein
LTATPILRVGPDNLQAGEHRAWRSRRPVRLRVQRGRVWVTASDSPDDHFLDAGMSLHLPAHAKVLLGAERHASVRLDLEPAVGGPTAWWRRLVQRLPVVRACEAGA